MRTPSQDSIALTGFHFFSFLFVIPALFSFSLSAQDLESVTLKKRTPASLKKEEGWHPSLVFQGNVSFGSNENVVGQQDGDTLTLGTNIDGGYSYYSARQEWRNTLNFTAATTKTPSIPRYVKSSDELKFETLYLYTFEGLAWLGPYAKASVETSAFKGEDVRETTTTYLFTDTGRSFTGTSLRLTDPFRPLTLKESAGAFAKIIEEESMKLEARLGFGAMQVKATNQYAIKDDAATPEVDVTSLSSYEQAGLEGGFNFTGLINETTTYSLSGEFLIPFIKDLPPGDDRDSLELTNYEIVAKLATKLNSWMNLNYEYKLKKQPQLLDKNQIQQLLLLNLSYTIF